MQEELHWGSGFKVTAECNKAKIQEPNSNYQAHNLKVACSRSADPTFKFAIPHFWLGIKVRTLFDFFTHFIGLRILILLSGCSS